MSSQTDKTSDPRFQKAAALIKAKRYDEARTLLKQIGTSKAQAWLDKLDGMTAVQSVARRSNTPVLLVLVLVVGLLIGGGLGYFIGRESVIGEIRNAFSGIGNSTGQNAELDSTRTAIASTNDAKIAEFTLTAAVPSSTLEPEAFALQVMQDALVKPLNVTVSDKEIAADIEVTPDFIIDDAAFSSEWELAKATCALVNAGFSQSYKLNAVQPDPDAFGNQNYKTLVTMQLFPETLQRLNCDAPHDISFEQVADGWTVFDN